MQNNRPAKNNPEFGTKSVPPIKKILAMLLENKTINHQDIIELYNGEKHRLAIAIQRLRDKYGFRELIQCPRSINHPLANHYFIAPCDIKDAKRLAIKHNLVIRKNDHD